jgi:hypothetical protein
VLPLKQLSEGVKLSLFLKDGGGDSWIHRGLLPAKVRIILTARSKVRPWPFLE